ncbi:YadA-like family protein [Histophilus somni]|uniref:YadA-like family protein n=1 Tax=Histophilus somni TaxID=731 RepID=UPI00201EB6B8|nr:YadA-like family protein [Histophilus somni]
MKQTTLSLCVMCLITGTSMNAIADAEQVDGDTVKSPKYYGIAAKSEVNKTGDQAKGKNVLVIGPGNTMPADKDGKVVESYDTVVLGSGNALRHLDKDKDKQWAVGKHTTGNTIVGQGNKSLGYSNYVVGQQNKAYGKEGILIGNGNETRGQRTIAMGDYAKSLGIDTIAQGFAAKALQSGAISIGGYSEAKALYATSVGDHAVTSVDTGVALGHKSLADRAGGRWGYIPEADKELKTARDIAEYVGKLEEFDALEKKLASDEFKDLAEKRQAFYAAVNARAEAEAKLEDAKIKIFDARTPEDIQSVLNEVNQLQTEYDAKREDELVKQNAYKGDTKYREYEDTRNQRAAITSVVYSTAGVVSVGNKREGIRRQITNVAAGSEDTDAVNIAQLKGLKRAMQKADVMLNSKIDGIIAKHNVLETRIQDVKKELQRGLASQAALNGLFQPYGVGKLNFTAAVGGYNSEKAIAVGSGYRFNDKIAVKAGIATNIGHSQGATYNVGFNMEW